MLRVYDSTMTQIDSIFSAEEDEGGRTDPEDRENLRESGVTTEMDWSRIPNVKPALESIFTSAEGNVWVEIPNLSGGTDYDVLASDGTYLGSVTAGNLGVYRWRRRLSLATRSWRW